MSRHRAFRFAEQRASFTRPDLMLLEGVVHPRILAAMHAASNQLHAANVRHALVGALAVGAYGYPRTTKDVDFLVGDEAFTHHAGDLVMIASGVPISAGGITVDPLSIAPDEEYLDEALHEAVLTTNVPVLPIAPLVYLKLKSPRRKDAVDVVELLKCGANAEDIAAYLEQHAPDLGDKFAELVAIAESEE